MADHAIADPTERPDHGSPYHPSHWAAYKGHVRGILRGLVVGVFMGALIGLGVALLAGPLGLAAIATAAGAHFTLGSVVAGFAAMGGIMGSEIMGRIGNAAGNIASHAAQTELRLRYPNLPPIGPDSPLPGWGHHYEVPPGRDKGKFFNLRVGLLGLGVGSAFGGLLGVSHIADHLLGHTLTHAIGDALSLSITGGLLPPLLPVVAGGLFGLSFGIERGIFKSIFNFTDNILQGRFRGPTQEELQKAREHYRQMSNLYPPSEITSLQRQEEYDRLQNEYFKAGFKAGFAGNSRGLLGGIIVGGLSGLALGGVLLAGLALTPFALPAGAGAFLVTLAGGLGGSLGFKIFTEAAFESAAHTEVDEIQKVRYQYLRKGIDLDFEKAAEIMDEKRMNSPEMTPPDAELGGGQWIKPKMMIMGAMLGVLSGLLLAPLAGPALAGILIGHGATTVGAGVCAAVFGLLGATFGLGSKITGGLIDLGDTVFMGTFNPGDKHPSVKTYGEIPLLERTSPFHPERQKCVNAAISQRMETSQAAHNHSAIADSGAQPEFIRRILAEKNRERKEQAMANFRDRMELKNDLSPTSSTPELTAARL